MIALPVKQRLLRSKNFTRIITEPIKLAMMHGLGQYSVLKLATDSIGSFTLTLTNVVVNSGVQIEVASTGASVSNSTASASTLVLTLPAYVPGSASNNLRIKVRKGTAAPFYQPYETLTTAFVGSASLYVSQISDQ